MVRADLHGCQVDDSDCVVLLADEEQRGITEQGGHSNQLTVESRQHPLGVAAQLPSNLHRAILMTRSLLLSASMLCPWCFASLYC